MKLWVPGDPVAQPRPKADNRRGGFARIYTPDPKGRLKGWKRAIRGLARCEWREERARCAVSVSLEFMFSRPASQMGTGRNAGRPRPSAPRHHRQRPDIDNLAKAVLDAMTGIVWADDAQIIELRITKRWAEKSGVLITVEEAT